jgi:hypothetical protein
VPTPDEEVTVRYTYRVGEGDGRVYAECEEVEVAGEGATRAEAVEALREALRLRLLSPDAVAPPERPGRHRVVLLEADPAVGP